MDGRVDRREAPAGSTNNNKVSFAYNDSSKGTFGHKDNYNSNVIGNGGAIGTAATFPSRHQQTAQTVAAKAQTVSLSSANIPVDAAGNPLPWSRDSVVQWAQKNGFTKFIPAFQQHGIEGYRFYTLRLEDMRGMKIPGVTMQDLIQLNAAIYRLNVASATPANRSHMTGTVRIAHTFHPAAAEAAAAAADSRRRAHSPATETNSQILGQPLRPLRPLRPSWSQRHDDPQPTHVREDVTAILGGQEHEPALASINTGMARRTAESGPSTVTPHAQSADGATRSWTTRTAAALQTAHRDAQTAAPADRSVRYATGSLTYRDRNSAHVEKDELPFVRPAQMPWKSARQRPVYDTAILTGLPRRRSAVVEVQDDATQRTNDPQGATRVAHSDGMPMPTAAVANTTQQPARYHGGNQPHSAYYAHGTATVGSFTSPTNAGAYRGLGSQARISPYATAANARLRQPLVATTTDSGRYQPVIKPHNGMSDAAAQGRGERRRTSISPVLSALQPGNYHIANLPDDLDDSTDGGGSSSGNESPETSQRRPIAVTGSTSRSIVLPAINTAALFNELRTSPCDTGDSIITPLSVVNVLPGMLSCSTSPSQASQLSQASQAGQLDHSFALQQAFAADPMGDLAAPSRRQSRLSHLRTPSMPLVLESFPVLRDDFNTARPRSSAEHRAQPATVFDAKSIASDLGEALSDDDHFDLIGNASSISDVPAVFDADEVAVFDAEEVAILDAEEIEDSGADDSRKSLIVFDAEEIEESDAEEIGKGLTVFDAEEVEDSDTEKVEKTNAERIGEPCAEQISGASPVGNLYEATSEGADGLAQTSPTFRVTGMRHVVSYGAEFDRTAATLLSSIKTDVARKVAASRGRRPQTPDAARIAEAIELHQRRQQQQDATAPAERHTGRFSGLFGFGQRTRQQQQQQHQALPPISAPQLPQPSQLPPPPAGLRVVTDLASLRAAPSNDAAPSSDGKKSSSPSTMGRRWRVPFRQRPAPAAPVVPAVDGDEYEVLSAATLASRRALRRSRYRAGTTSDIESPVARSAAAVDRPFSMVESGSSGSSSAAAATPAGKVPSPQAPSVSLPMAGMSPAAALASTAVLASAVPSPRSVAGSLSPLGSTDAEATSPSSFVTARDAAAATTSASSCGSASDTPAACNADSWTLMFFNSEFVVPNPAARNHTEQPVSVLRTEPVAAAAPEPREGLRQEPGQVLCAEQGQQSPQQNPVENAHQSDGDSAEDHFHSATLRFTRGMRATLLQRRPSAAGRVAERPTADAIGEQLDEYFPGHDLDRRIVQPVPVAAGLLPSHEFHIILDDTRPAPPPPSGQPDTESPSHAGPTPQPPRDIGVGRRKSVRMLVQETRWRRRQNQPPPEPEATVPTFEPAAPADELSASNGSLQLHSDDPELRPAAVVRRKSTKLWGCIPEEIHLQAPHSPRRRRRRRPRTFGSPHLHVPAKPPPQPHVPPPLDATSSTDEIVRRALSLLRKPEPNPQAEKAIVEAAMRCNDGSGAGSTRAQFAQDRALQCMGVGQSEDGVAVGQPEDAAQAQGSSVGDAVRALFAKYGIGPGGVRFQWIKGKLIGRGSFGHVHVAINAGTGEVIAVKQIRVARRVRAAEAEDARQRAQQLAAAQMMYTEVAVLRDLDHENIVQLLGFEVAGGVMSMFLEYVAGGTVQSLVQQHGPLHEPTVHSFVAQIARGLAYLHACAIVHRDIKGANILVDETGTCKISDFGISRKADRERLVEEVRAIPADPAKSVTPADPAKPAKPAPSRMLGTVPFMAPEVVRSSEYSAAADIWAFGCVVVQMWSGRQPWDDLQEPQVFFKLGRGEAPSIPDDLTDAGLDFCKKCFATDPRRRWSANHLAGLPFAHVSPTYEYPYRADFSA